MRPRGVQVWRWGPASSCRCPCPPLPLLTYSTLSSPPDPAPPEQRGGAEAVKERSLAALKLAGMLGRKWGQRSSQVATDTVNYWWARYEEFVGLNEVREAQSRVTEAETSFMVSRGLVQEAQAQLEAVQLRLKEVRTRLDRVSREEPHYLELATLEHKLLQEERRERGAYEGAELQERQRFSHFSAAVRSSHEKERTRAERTKNWSLIGSLLGTLLGVLGSTYINRVRLQELRSLLLEAQKGPESLQEVLSLQAVQHHRQHSELQALIDTLGGSVGHTPQATPSHAPAVTPADSPLAALQPYLAHLDGGVARLEQGVVGLEGGVAHLDKGVAQVEEGLSRLEGGVSRLEGGVSRLEGGVAAFKSLEEEEEARRRRRSSSVGAEPVRWGGVLEEEVLRRVEEAQERLEVAVQRSSVTNSAVTVVAAAITVPLVYFLLRAAA